ncbi:heat-inducible transcriptional repressor [Nitratiruptor sp. YY08-26]|uniref:hypothetical protein n=1 Tax=unclassified Nitratiruptor TaxID=2624044 RepID=UPI001914E01C|nr:MULTISPECIES: hypothetical protein [unclassified Nitratiruptor]BCD61991.1 heat-inducible transcriptional repressor [Nitratiruptor sp. YY08-13]BCD65927.1 heat-inducible transcriptional repressor [Nitratiruptor sp. YY08-26]
MNKSQYVLEGLIEEYIDNPVPISSKYLHEHCIPELSSATIRYYFKKLTEKGYLLKQHVSSGRIPSEMALKMYWIKKLQKKSVKVDDAQRLQKIDECEEIFYEYGIYNNPLLKSIDNYKNKYIIALFENSEFLLPYNKKVEQQLQKMIGLGAFDITNFFTNIGYVSVGKRLKEFIQEDFKIYNDSEIIAMAQQDSSWAKANLYAIYSGQKLLQEDVGLRFSHMFLSYKFYIDLPKNLKGEMLLMGRLYRNYHKCIKNLMKE